MIAAPGQQLWRLLARGGRGSKDGHASAESPRTETRPYGKGRPC